jgi:hypothetical protein
MRRCVQPNSTLYNGLRKSRRRRRNLRPTRRPRHKPPCNHNGQKSRSAAEKLQAGRRTCPATAARHPPPSPAGGRRIPPGLTEIASRRASLR